MNNTRQLGIDIEKMSEEKAGKLIMDARAHWFE